LNKRVHPSRSYRDLVLPFDLPDFLTLSS